MKQLPEFENGLKSEVDFQIKSMIIRDLTHAYDHLDENDRLMRFYIAKAVLDLHLKYKNSEL
ncbi:MAG: hypothetical protein ACTSRP_10650 [Candidatus Helarchaeota archaeon]